MPKINQPPNAIPTTPTTPAISAHAQLGWHVRFPGATPDRVWVKQAWSSHPDDLHIVGAGSRDVVHGRWGGTFYHTWAEAIAATIEMQEAKIAQLENDLAWNRDQLDRLHSLTEPEPEPQPQSQE